MDPLLRYLIFGSRHVEGWLSADNAELIAGLSRIQRAAKCVGATGEIGVHHGKLLLVLLLTASAEEQVFAIDVFDQQHLNVDNSGKGDRARFLANVSRWAGEAERLHVIAKSSFDVRPEEIVAACGKVRLASIDGGHTDECTLNDLRLIESVLTDRGVVIVDDCFNPEWPGVSGGVARYLLSGSPKLRPFAISTEKVFFTAPENSAFYRAQLSSKTKFRPSKQASLYGCEVDIYTFRPDRVTTAWRVKEFVKSSAMGPYALGLKEVLRGSRDGSSV